MTRKISAEERLLPEKSKRIFSLGQVSKYRGLDMSLAEMEAGAFFVKWKSVGWKKTRYLELVKDHLSLLISKQSCGLKNNKLINIKKIKDVRKGYPAFVSDSKLNKPQANQCFSLVLEGHKEIINLIAVNADSAAKWIKGIQHLSSNMENLDAKGKHLLWIWEHFKKADKDSNNLLSFKEVKKLLNQLNFEASDNYIEAKLKEFDETGDQCLSFEEFVEFFKKITWRPEIERLYKNYCDSDLKLQPKEICRFFHNDQGVDNMTPEMAVELIEKYEPDDELKAAKEMSVYGFTYMLMSRVGNIFNFEHRKVCMDMNQPLSHYFIASSHNTYLTDDQLFGKSSVESYIRALERGCRCVELDCWDGDDGEPIIYHGYTLTSKIKFADVIEVVRDYAFKASDYPVILSIENHCSVEQQTKMAKILKSCLGSRLLTSLVNPDATVLPSPEALKGKILVKGKRLPGNCDSDGEVSDEDEAADVEEDGVKKKEKKNESIKLSRALSSIVVYAISRHFKTFADAKDRSDYRYISSLNEDKAERLAEKDPKEFVIHNTWQLVRIYPKGTRTNSSNYSPLPLWNAGCQIVALNYQTEDAENYLNESRFRSNGACGYVLKPPCLLAAGGFDALTVDSNSPHADPTELTIRIISAQQMPKPPNNKKDLIDPYVEVSILGCNVDKQTQKTSTIENNGFNPLWVEDDPMKFKVLVPSLAFVQFKVMDHDSRGEDDLVGLYALPFNDIAKGYRHVHLQTEGRHELSPATVFVNISIAKLDKL